MADNYLNEMSRTLPELYLGAGIGSKANSHIRGMFGASPARRMSSALERDEQSSARLASLASRALRDPGSLTHEEIRSLAGSVLTQAPNRSMTIPA